MLRAINTIVQNPQEQLTVLAKNSAPKIWVGLPKEFTWVTVSTVIHLNPHHLQNSLNLHHAWCVANAPINVKPLGGGGGGRPGIGVGFDVTSLPVVGTFDHLLSPRMTSWGWAFEQKN